MLSHPSQTETRATNHSLLLKRWTLFIQMEDSQNKHEINANETKLKQTGKVSYSFCVSQFVQVA